MGVALVGGGDAVLGLVRRGRRRLRHGAGREQARQHRAQEEAREGRRAHRPGSASAETARARRDAGAARGTSRTRPTRSAIRVRSCTSPASWPQAAAMSSPRVRRTVVTMPPSWSTAAKAATRAAGERDRPDPGNGLNGIRLTLQAIARPSPPVAANEREQRRGLLRGIVDAVEHAVFERDEIARRALEVAPARSEQRRDRVLAVERNELVAQAVVGRVQRDRQRHRAVVAQPLDHRHDA